MILLNLYGISIDTHFYPFLSYMVHPTKSLASVGLAQARPNEFGCYRSLYVVVIEASMWLL